MSTGWYDPKPSESVRMGQDMDRRTVLALCVASATAIKAGPAAGGQDRAKVAKRESPNPVKLIAIYDRPDDTEAFFKHYETIHAPLVKKTPGLQSFVLNRITEGVLGGEPPYVLIAEMTYPDRASFEAAMNSPENQAAGRDLATFARGKVRVMVADSTDA
jgi:uncharacterized protein (TIGR02118 family)